MSIESIMPLYIKPPQMNGYVKYLKDSKRMTFLFHDEELLKNTMQYEIELIVYLKKSSIVTHCIMINMKKLK